MEKRIADVRESWPKIAAGQKHEWRDKPHRGLSHQAALALFVLDLDLVHRSTLRALLPDTGRTQGSGKGKSRLTLKLNWALRCFQVCRWVWLLHGTDGRNLIWVNDRDALLGWVLGAVDPQPEITYRLLQVGRAAQQLATELDAEPDEVRRTELLALRRLMERGPGANCFQRRPVRIVPKASVL